MRTFHFKHVDVFTTKPLQGNPLVVFPDAAELSGMEMQSIAREFNLSETTFVSNPTTPDATYRNRIFTPTLELPFAGHPSIGTAYVLAKEGRRFQLAPPVTQVKQEIGIGILPLEIHSDGASIGMIEMTQGTPRIGEIITDTKRLAELLNILEEEIGTRDLQSGISSTGINQLMIPVKSLEVVVELKPDVHGLEEYSKQIGADGGVYIFTRETMNGEADIHARFFGAGVGVSEDPATGSAAGALGAYLAYAKQLPKKNGKFIIEQGLEMGRPSLIHVHVEDDAQGTRVKVGGNVVDVLLGEISL